MSIIYRSELLYNSVMRFLYRKHFQTRLQAVDRQIDFKQSVLELCCGTGTLYLNYLKKKEVTYLGIDNSEKFISSLKRRGVNARYKELAPHNFPEGLFDIVIMQGSLYQFIPNQTAILAHMVKASKKKIIICEPIINMTTSKIPFFSWLAKNLTKPLGDNKNYHGNRFTIDTLKAALQPFTEKSFSCEVICEGREALIVIEKL